jgi:hypothetical protein
MLWIWDPGQMKEDVKLHLLSGGGIFLRGSDIVGAGVCWYPIAKEGSAGEIISRGTGPGLDTEPRTS